MKLGGLRHRIERLEEDRSPSPVNGARRSAAIAVMTRDERALLRVLLERRIERRGTGADVPQHDQDEFRAIFAAAFERLGPADPSTKGTR